jgi:O-acetyl-ADP-ribose deacetylase (regulator of RNase III)
MNKRTYQAGRSTLTIEFGDITTSDADVLVSSDDTYVTMGGGVSAAILRAGGQSILIDAAKKVPCTVGDVVVTSAGSLRAKHIFHAITLGNTTASPKRIIATATKKCLELLDALALQSIAFPAVGAGVARFAYEDVAATMAEVMVQHLRSGARPISASIYLFDRIGDLQPIDFATFFEQFAVRTKGLRLRTAKPPERKRAERAKSPRTLEEHRRTLLLKLAELDRDRHELETRLAEHDPSASDTQALESQLGEVHKQYVTVLAEVKPTTWPLGVTVRELREAILTAFDAETLQLFRADLEEQLTAKGIAIRLSKEALGGEGMAAQVQNLIDALRRRRQLPALVEAVRRERPELLADVRK